GEEKKQRQLLRSLCDQRSSVCRSGERHGMHKHTSMKQDGLETLCTSWTITASETTERRHALQLTALPCQWTASKSSRPICSACWQGLLRIRRDGLRDS